MIISIGEIVWDVFGDKQALGGAPVNVAYHLLSLNMAVQVVSRVGADDLGRLTLRKITALGLPVHGIQQDETLPTGQVNITIDRHNEPHFDIIAPAAWDNIDRLEATHLADTIAPAPFHLVFGTLAQRHEVSRAAIRELWRQAALKFYDVNLRPPFTTRELLLDSLQAADIVKMNIDELNQIAVWLAINNADKTQLARELLARFNLQVIAVTEGKDGAWLISRDGLFTHPGYAATVADTVGAGDAFFATLIEGILLKRPWPECLARANRRGSYVASRTGATPPMESEDEGS